VLTISRSPGRSSGTRVPSRFWTTTATNLGDGMQDVLKDLLAKRRDRVIAIILGTKERDCDQYLPKEAQAKLRKVVLDQVNEFYELTCDVLRSCDTDSMVMNDLYLQRLDEIHEVIVRNGHVRS
jgi:hypothetical protein